MNKKRKHILFIILITLALIGCVFLIREYGLKEKRLTEEKRQTEILAFWNNYEEAKNQDNELAKKIKDEFVNEMSKELSMEELLVLINNTLSEPITLEELIEK